MTSIRLLLVEDNEDDALLVLRHLRGFGLEIQHTRVDAAPALARALAAGPWDFVISDYTLPRFNALQALALVREHDPDLPFIIVSGTIVEEDAVAAMRAGAHDFVTKGRLARLVPAVERELRRCPPPARRPRLSCPGRSRSRLSQAPLRP